MGDTTFITALMTWCPFPETDWFLTKTNNHILQSSSHHSIEYFYNMHSTSAGNSFFFLVFIYHPRQIKYPVNFDGELKIGDVRYDKMIQITIKVQLFWRLLYEMWKLCLKNEPFMSNRRFKKGCFFEKSQFLFFLLSNFCTLFAKNGLFATRPPLLNRW